MKQPRFATSLKLSKLCRLLTTAVCIKLVVISILAMDLTGWNLPFMTEGPIKMDRKAPVETTQPVAKATQEVQPAPAATLLPVSQAHAADPAPAAPPQDALTREALQQKQQDLSRREQDLARVQKEIDQKLERLQGLEKRLAQMLKEAKDTKDKKMRHLVDVYSNMKAKQAAQVLETLDEKIAVKILAGMRGRQAGEILTFVKPDKAARLSEALTKLQLPFE